MKRTIFVMIFSSSLYAATGAVFAGSQQTGTKEPTRAEIQQKAMQDGPSTSQFGYVTYKASAAPSRNAAPTDPKLLRPLTQREIGMLYNACVAYSECATAYGKAYEHNQALLRAQKAESGPGQ
jgi:hypothetical protein